MIDFDQYKHLMGQGKRVYFIGVGGISISGLAELSLSGAQIVAGSDLHPNDRCRRLEELGALIFPGHLAQNVLDFSPDALVYSAAVPPDNPEWLEAERRGIPCIERSDWLGLINRSHETVVNIAGTNGKSTTTAMTSLIAVEAGLDPSIHIGAALNEMNGATVRAGRAGGLMISEACEFHQSFHSFYSTTAAVLNLGHDHVDCFPTMEDLIESFAVFLSHLSEGANLVLPAFDPSIPPLLASLERLRPGLRDKLRIYSFGYEDNRFMGRMPDLYATEIQLGCGSRFRLHFRGEDLGLFELLIPGRFNIENAMAAVLLAHLQSAPFAAARLVLGRFKGAVGRFNLCGQYRGATIIEDYAHHPDSVRLSLEAARARPHRRVLACFQPITYSRAKGKFQEFVEVFLQEEHALLVEVFDDRERDHSFSFAEVAAAVNEKGGNARFFASPAELERYLREEIQEGDLVLLMGQDIRKIGRNLCP